MGKLTEFEKRQYINILFQDRNYKNLRKNMESLYVLNSEIPFKFYRYRSLANEYEINNILQGQIWLSAPTEFNDPYDSMINIDVDEMLKRYFDSDREILHQYNSLERKDKRKANRYLKSEKAKLQKELNKELERLRKSFGIACFSETCDNLLMWSHYADYHKGICLEYNFKEITNLGVFCPVVYTSRFENLVNYVDIKKDEISEKAIKLFLCKSKDWSYENEWRIIDILSNDSEEKGKILKGLKPQKILMGCKIGTIDENKITEVANKLHIPIKKMKMDTKKFRVYIDK